VLGSSNDGEGVAGRSQTGTGTSGGSTSGTGVEGGSVGGTGVKAVSRTGFGLSATGTQGVGASFRGGAAAIRLVPRSTTGQPTSGHHKRGELVVDKAGVLWLCSKAGTPGKWKQLAFA
jgi:hypothetical protein